MDYIAHHSPIHIGFLSQEHWNGLPFPFYPDLEHGVAPLSPPAPMQLLLLGWEALTYHEIHKNFLKSFKHVKTILSSPANHKQVVDQI